MKPDRRLMSRREFLIAAGCGCAATVLVGSGCARNSAAAAADTVVCPYGYVYDTWPGQCPRYVDSNGSGYCDYSEPIAATTATTLQTTDSALTTATDTTVAAPSATATAPAATATAPAEATAAATATAAAPTTTAVAPTATAVAPTATTAALVVLCNRGCRAPGRCGRFTDNNGSGRCDLSEGIPADQAAQYAQPGGRGG